MGEVVLDDVDSDSDNSNWQVAKQFKRLAVAEMKGSRGNNERQWR